MSNRLLDRSRIRSFSTGRSDGVAFTLSRLFSLTSEHRLASRALRSKEIITRLEVNAYQAFGGGVYVLRDFQHSISEFQLEVRWSLLIKQLFHF